MDRNEIFQKTKNEILQQFHSSFEGLTSESASQMLLKYGYNELPQAKQKNCFRIFAEQFQDFLVLILIIAAILSGFMGDPESAIVIFVVLIMNAILGTVQQINAEKSLNSLKNLSAPHAKVLRDGIVRVIPAREVAVGDVVILEAGDCVCADGRILENASLKINESALTGESVSVEKEDCVIAGKVPVADQSNMVFSGSFVTYGRGKFLVTHTGSDTEVGKIASLIKNSSESKTPLQISLDQFGRRLSVFILIICGILFGLSVLRGGQIMDAFLFAVALAVAAIPEALSSIVTIVLAFGTKKMVKEHVIIRKLQAVEGLGSVSVICSDKTGTLTQNKMTVMKYYTDGRMTDCFSSSGAVPDECALKLIDFGVLCSDASIENGTEVGDPTEIALLNLSEQYHISAVDTRNRYQREGEIPFDSDRKLMSVALTYKNEPVMITKGAVDVLCGRMTSILTSEGIRPFTPEDQVEIECVNESFSGEGLRVLAVAYKETDNRDLQLSDEKDLIFLGLIAMMDPPRRESVDAVAKCIAAGIRPIMITGDHKKTAAAIAKQIGICHSDAEVTEGAVIDSMSEKELQDFVEQISVYARVSPEHKIRIVRAWQKKGNIVAMTGDGVNDAPALKQADIGVAMGITGSEVAKDASSMILTDDNFASIVKAVENGRNVYANIKKSIRFLLSGNMAGILSVLYASILGLPVPFAPVHLLFINLLTDSLPAIALGLDPHSDCVMQQKPRQKNESILTAGFTGRIFTEGLVIGIFTMIAYDIGLRAGGESLARTMAFATLCLSRLFHGFSCKSDKPVLFTREFLNNKYLIGAFCIGFLLLNAVLLIPAFHSVFQVGAINFVRILFIYLLSACSMLTIQCLKWLKLRNNP